MKKTHKTPRSERIRVSIIANPLLVREGLSVLLSSNKDFEVVNTIGFESCLSKLKPQKNSDVAVIYLETLDPADLIGEMHKIFPAMKIVAITDGDDLDNATRALKLGAVGIVQSVQGSNLLFEAIRQAYKGETWLNQELLSNLLENGNGSNGSKHHRKIGPVNDFLTPREVEVVSMIGKGLKSKLIAEELSISEATVRHHLSSIYGKLGVDDRLNLVIYAFEHGLVRVSEDSE